MKVVVDAGPIVALSKAGQLTLLPQLFDEVVVPQSVIEELAGHGGLRGNGRRRFRPVVRATALILSFRA